MLKTGSDEARLKAGGKRVISRPLELRLREANSMSLSTDVKSLTVPFGAAVGRGQRLALGVTTFLVLLLFGTFFSSLAQATQRPTYRIQDLYGKLKGI